MFNWPKIHVKVTKILRICRKKFGEYPPCALVVRN